jgi:hypothetical protein
LEISRIVRYLCTISNLIYFTIYGSPNGFLKQEEAIFDKIVSAELVFKSDWL